MFYKLMIVLSLLILMAGRTALAEEIEPDISNMRYGPHQDNVFDLYLPQNTANPPIAVFIHGGGFKSGDKSQVHDAGHLLTDLLDAGIAVVSANYRLLSSTSDLTLDEILKEDLTALVQTVRYRAPNRGRHGNAIGAFGTSAGAGAALWLGVHDDVADPRHPLPFKRVSSKVQVVGHLAGQATYDTALWSEILQVIPNWAALIDFEDDLLWFDVDIRRQLTHPAVIAKIMSIDFPGLMSPDDAFLYVENYTPETDIVLSSDMSGLEKSAAKVDIAHSPRHAYFLEKICQVNGLFCEVYTERNMIFTPAVSDMVDFFKTHLQ